MNPRVENKASFCYGKSRMRMLLSFRMRVVFFLSLFFLSFSASHAQYAAPKNQLHYKSIASYFDLNNFFQNFGDPTNTTVVSDISSVHENSTVKFTSTVTTAEVSNKKSSTPSVTLVPSCSVAGPTTLCTNSGTQTYTASTNGTS
ncbi:MAG TPA: hypothetical protein VGG71_09990, partial [Chitinophagaceae bacterium]